MKTFFEEGEKLTTQYTEGLICNLEYLYALQELTFTQAQREVAILKQQRIEIDRQLNLTSESEIQKCL